MPHETKALTPRQQRASKAERARKLLAGATLGREDSDDELGTDDHPWEWIYAESSGNEKDEEDDHSSDESGDDGKAAAATPRKRKSRNATKSQGGTIVGARMGTFICKIGDPVLLKAEGQNSSWVGIIYQFLEDDDGEKSANFLCMLPIIHPIYWPKI